MNLAIIGLGPFSTNYRIPNLLNRPDVTVTAVCDISRDRLDVRDSRLAPATAFTDAHALLDSGNIDGLIVSTPNASHFEICHDALYRDIPVLVDKPITVGSEHAQELVDLSKRRNCILMTAFTRHFMSSTEFVRRQIRSGKIEIQTITGVQRRSRSKARTKDGGMLHRRTVHIIDLLSWLTDRSIVSVTADIRYEEADIEEEHLELRLELQEGLQAHILCIKNCEDYQDEVNIYGSNGSYRLERPRLFELEKSGWHRVEDLPDYGNATDHFVDALHGKNPGPDDPFLDRHSEDGLRSIRIVEAIHESARTGLSVAVPQ
jgi:UDP-N-acetyl-2-amino-2-deoxyglucuronate dehydrogenase